MSAYIILYGFITFGIFFKKKLQMHWILLSILILIFFVGLRHFTGGDWINYYNKFIYILPYLDLKGVIFHSDPIYWIISYFMYKLGYGIYGTNLVISIVFFIGLYKLIMKTPLPLIGLIIAFPYLIVVVSMGYVRQAAAIGLIMWGLSYYMDKKIYIYLFFNIIAILFHKSAFFMLGIVLFSLPKKHKLLTFLSILLISIGLYAAFVAKSEEHYINSYVNSYISSSGAFIRVFMNIVPAMLFFYYKKEWKKEYDDYLLWRNISFLAIVSIFFVKIASTAIDRLSLYFIPLQIIVFSRVLTFVKNKKLILFLIIIYYWLVLLVWLKYATHAYMWLPYKNVLFLDLI